MEIPLWAFPVDIPLVGRKKFLAEEFVFVELTTVAS